MLKKKGDIMVSKKDKEKIIKELEKKKDFLDPFFLFLSTEINYRHYIEKVKEYLAIAYFTIWDEIIFFLNQKNYIMENDPVKIAYERIDWRNTSHRILRNVHFNDEKIEIVVSLHLFNRSELKYCSIPVNIRIVVCNLKNNDEKIFFLPICLKEEFSNQREMIFKELTKFLNMI